MAEIRKINFETIKSDLDIGDRDFIPSNWYIPARKAWAVFAWAMIQIRHGAVIRRDSDVNDFVHKFWEYIEDRAVSIGEEREE